MSCADKVKELIAKQLNKPVADITEEKDVKVDLGADSLDVVDMIMSFEDEFGISVPDEEAVNIKTVGDIIKLIDEKASK
ncbi:MAG TPA: acyl carrier protein [Clostridiales bacterium]|nr:acyl carrier protein [Clostridiales bacterium]